MIVFLDIINIIIVSSVFFELHQLSFFTCITTLYNAQIRTHPILKHMHITIVALTVILSNIITMTSIHIITFILWDIIAVWLQYLYCINFPASAWQHCHCILMPMSSLCR